MKQAVDDLARAADKGIDLDAYRQGGLDYSDVESVTEEGPAVGGAQRDCLEVMIGSSHEDAQNEEWTYKLMAQVISLTIWLLWLGVFPPHAGPNSACTLSPGVQVFRHVG